MIAFDNGPANGDYARYIDELMQRAAVAASAGILTEAAGDASRRTRDTAIAPTSSRAAASLPRQRDVSTIEPGPHGSATRRAMPQSPSNPQSTGFVTPTDASAKASAAAAVATALMSGEMGPRSLRARAAAVGAVLGALLLFVGLVVPLAFSSVLIVGGVVLLGWAFRMIKGTWPRTPGSASTRA